MEILYGAEKRIPAPRLLPACAGAALRRAFVATGIVFNLKFCPAFLNFPRCSRKSCFRARLSFNCGGQESAPHGLHLK
jgi:hypothetical protein